MSDFESLKNELLAFRDERDWKQFHNSKDLAMAISIESNELLELFLWKDPKDANEEKIKEELADVVAYVLLLAHNHNIDMKQAILDKIEKNRMKYPVEKAKGNAKKYTEL
ncbi:hypothetical protein [Microcystis phage Mwe-JY31]